LRIELESSTGINFEIEDVNEESEDSYIVKFVLKGKGGEKL
jgi:hypothetical protein